MITVRGVELDFNFLDADHVQRLVDARKDLAEKHKNIMQTDVSKVGLEEYAGLLRQACQVFFDLFDEQFGDGTSNKLFGKTCNLETVLDIYQEFEQAVAGQSEAFAKKAGAYVPDTATKKKGKK